MDNSLLFTGDANDFPESSELPEGVKQIELEDDFGYGVNLIPNILYAQRDGEDLHIQLLLPTDKMDDKKTYPLIVYVQGSAWFRQKIFSSLQRLLRVCEQGYAVAIVQYRPSDVAPFPAQIQDTKTAIRFLRKNASEYKVDPERVAIWGDSSGGHTAVMVGITDDGELDSELDNDYSAKVKCIVDWYGPTDISRMSSYPSTMDHNEPQSPEGMLIGGKTVNENPENVAPTIPMNYVSADKGIPPILIMHGSKDPLVHFNQSCILYNKLKEMDKEVEMYKLKGAYHGHGGFNSSKALNIVLEFIVRYI